jgi:hypothetical protein
MKKFIIKLTRRSGTVVLHTLFGNMFFLGLLGLVNRCTGRRIKTIFLLYPANEKFTRAYVFDWYAELCKWSPTLCGFFKQNNRWGLSFAISSSEKHFIEQNNRDLLHLLEARVEKIRRLVGAQQKTFAGILPGLLVTKKIVTHSPENKTTVAAIIQAIGRVKQEADLPADAPIIVLGGFGFVGRELVTALQGDISPIHPVDIHNKSDFDSIAASLRPMPVIVLNLTKRGALREYALKLWPGTVVLNEVYPEPGREELEIMAEQGTRCWHIVGAKGQAWPPFPSAYRNGIPCCASFLPDGGTEGDYEVIIEQLSAVAE